MMEFSKKFRELISRIVSLPGFNIEFSIQIGRDGQCVLRSNQPMDKLPAYVIEVHGTVAGAYMVRCLKCGFGKSASVVFGGLFIVGNLVRYKPDFWMKEIESAGSGGAAMVEAFCNFAQRRFPNDMLELIWRERFEYGVPARLA